MSWKFQDAKRQRTVKNGVLLPLSSITGTLSHVLLSSTLLPPFCLKMGYIRGRSVLSSELSWRWGMVDKGRLASGDEVFTRKGVS